ncbi:MAG: hypothetical protein ABI863_20590 [Ginsengibacter sp.]
MTDIGFYRFSWIGWFFSMDFGYLINVVEHQSTSGTKIHNPSACARAILPDFTLTVFTALMVCKRFGT